jgi:hypothetical protein
MHGTSEDARPERGVCKRKKGIFLVGENTLRLLKSTYLPDASSVLAERVDLRHRVLKRPQCFRPTRKQDRIV